MTTIIQTNSISYPELLKGKPECSKDPSAPPVSLPTAGAPLTMLPLERSISPQNIEQLLSSDPIVIISSKKLSTRVRNILSDTGRLKEFDFKKYGTWSVPQFLTTGEPHFTFFDITDRNTMLYVQNNFKEIPKNKVILLKHSHETNDEDWISAVQRVIPEAAVVTHIPEIRELGQLTKQLVSAVAIPEPISKIRKILKALLGCVASSL